MRLFLAIDLPSEVKRNIDRQLEKIKTEYAYFNWVPPENYHITVHFFGETNEVDKIRKKITEILYDQEKFYLYSRDIDLFINTKIVIYLNFRKEKKLEDLVKKIRSSFNGGDKKKFVPHLTLARSRIPSKQQYFAQKKKLRQIDINVSFPVEKLVLFRSLLEGKKPVYEKIDEFFLIAE